MNGYLVDTNIPSELTKEQPDARVVDFIRDTNKADLYLSVMVIGEISKGIAALPEGKKRRALEDWLQADVRLWFGERILPVTEAIAIRWGHLAAEARQQGASLPVVDGLIAATALHHGLTLVTRNTKDFPALGVKILNPWDAGNAAGTPPTLFAGPLCFSTSSADERMMNLVSAGLRPFRCVLLMLIGFVAALPSSAQKVRPDSQKAALPSLTGDVVTPSRGVGPFDPKLAKEWRDTAETLCAQSRYAEAEKLYLRLLEEREHSLGLNSPELASDLNDLGRVSFAQMKYQQAASYYECSLQIMETSKGRQDLAVVGPLEKLARISQAMEKYTQAEQYARRAVAVVERVQGPDAPELAPELIAVGELLLVEKQYSSAEPMFDRAVRILEKSAGAASPALRQPLDGIAEAFGNMRLQSDAEAVWRRALYIRESAFGPATVEVAGTLDHLGKLYFTQKRYPEASYCYERALYIRTKALGEAAPETQATLSEVANVYAAAGRQTDAEPLFRGMLTAKELDTVASLNSLAALLALKNPNVVAESQYKLSIELLDKKGFVTARKPVLTPGDTPPPELAETLDQYTALLKKMRKRAEAARMEARAHILHGALAAAPAPAGKKAQ